MWQAITSKPITECKDEWWVRERRREREGERGKGGEEEGEIGMRHSGPQQRGPGHQVTVRNARRREGNQQHMVLWVCTYGGSVPCVVTCGYLATTSRYTHILPQWNYIQPKYLLHISDILMHICALLGETAELLNVCSCCIKTHGNGAAIIVCVCVRLTGGGEGSKRTVDCSVAREII